MRGISIFDDYETDFHKVVLCNMASYLREETLHWPYELSWGNCWDEYIKKNKKRSDKMSNLMDDRRYGNRSTAKNNGRSNGRGQEGSDGTSDKRSHATNHKKSNGGKES